MLFGGRKMATSLDQGSSFSAFKIKAAASRVSPVNPLSEGGRETGKDIFRERGRSPPGKGAAASALAGKNLFAAAMSRVASLSPPQPQPDVTVFSRRRPSPVAAAAAADDAFESEEEEGELRSVTPVKTSPISPKRRGRFASDASETASEVSESGTKRPRIKRIVRFEQL